MPFGFAKKGMQTNASDAAPGAGSTPRPSDVYAGLRGMALKRSPDELGMTPTDDLPDVWGMVIDMGMAGGIATIVALADGTTSLYLSSGGGVIGSGSKPPVAAATRALLATAQHYLALFDSTEIPAAATSQASLIVLTYTGRRTASAAMTALQDERHPFASVWASANAVMSQLRIDAARSPDGPPRPTSG